ncbi:DUF3019 domain-containing protein [Shewanella intestini]|uniref:DUF3019 domain-containing protein n=1 Tax=Shewanella intestini TaxID=2017544 RepID=A0ABS5I1M8_9GAMM|nr:MULTISPECIES: DUF3019 domain-containing protein [Shewanella]MBR9727928.1 DUF3019 domain-containing protein [Shewanella intestini]MRG36521.1 DUF3019 domain-containing protein [Shewanella sp. XMDDZSB0408]
MSALKIFFCLLIITLHTKKSFADAPGTAWKITPNNCYSQDGHCESDVIVEWQTPDATHFCIKIEDKNEPEFCSNGELSGQQAFSLKAMRTKKIFIINPQNQRLLSTLTFRIVTDSVPRNPRKRRHSWSIL